MSITNNDMLGAIQKEGRYGLRVYEAILDKNESVKLGKEEGRYVSVNVNQIVHSSYYARKYVSNVLANEIRSFLKSKNVLVVGLGNAFLVADSFGSLVIKDLLVTHDIPLTFRKNLADVSALIPGVSGINGFPTDKLVKAVADFVSPKQVIVIDTFVAHKLERIGCSFQLSDTGISAGAGLGRKNQSLNRDYLGVPVLSIGVPFMINACEFESNENFVVTPKEIDIICKNCSKILARALNIALHGRKYLDYL